LKCKKCRETVTPVVLSVLCHIIEIITFYYTNIFIHYFSSIMLLAFTHAHGFRHLHYQEFWLVDFELEFFNFL